MILVRRVMISVTGSWSRCSTPSTIARSALWNTPAVVPCLIMCEISSSDGGTSTSLPKPNAFKITLVEIVRNQTNGAPIVESTVIGFASNIARASGLVSAMRLGTSSPMMREKYVSAPTTISMAYTLLKGTSAGN